MKLVCIDGVYINPNNVVSVVPAGHGSGVCVTFTSGKYRIFHVSLASVLNTLEGKA